MRVANSKLIFCWLYLPATFLLLTLIVVSECLNIPFSEFTRDPLAITGGHPFLGIISNVGVLLWSFSAAVCFFSYALLKKIKIKPDVLRFILFGGLISTVMLLDDLFMLHEYIYPRHFGINQKIIFSCYGLLVSYYLFEFRAIIKETYYLFILLALCLFALSVLVDILPKNLLPWHHLFEDGPKFLGIVSWFSYQLTVCFQEVQSVSCNLGSNTKP